MPANSLQLLQHERKPGRSEAKRTLGSVEENYRKRLKKTDNPVTSQEEV